MSNGLHTHKWIECVPLILFFDAIDVVFTIYRIIGVLGGDWGSPGQNVPRSECPPVRMSPGQNVPRSECPPVRMSPGQNVRRSECPRACKLSIIVIRPPIQMYSVNVMTCLIPLTFNNLAGGKSASYTGMVWLVRKITGYQVMLIYWSERSYLRLYVRSIDHDQYVSYIYGIHRTWETNQEF